MFCFLFVDEDWGIWEVIESIGVIEVEVGEDDGGYTFERDLFCFKLAVDLVIAVDGEFVLRGAIPISEQAFAFEVIFVVDFGAFAGVDEEYAFGVFDGHNPDGEPFGEAGVDDGVDGGEWGFPTRVAEF